MPNCKICGEEITDKQESEFNKKCPFCVRNKNGNSTRVAIFYASLFIIGILIFIGGIIIRAITELYPYDSITMIESTSYFLIAIGLLIVLIGFLLELSLLNKTSPSNK